MNHASSKQQAELLERFKAGDQDAANELIGLYFDRTVRAASKRIAQRRLRGSASEDIAVSVFESLWKKVDQKEFREEDLIDTNEFWRLLCKMIRFKTEDHVRREQAGKRGGGMLRGESIFGQQGEELAGLAGHPDARMTADEIAAFQDEHTRLLSVLEEPVLQEIVTLRMEEKKVSEIAEHFARSERWVKRKLARIREVWSHETGEGR